MRYAIMLVAVVWTAVCAAEPVVANPGFEEAGDKGLPASWSGPADVYQRDASVAHSGGASLKFVNADAGRYALCSQKIDLDAGRMYEISAWVKTQGVQGDDSGATICAEWHGADGKYVGGCYPRGVKGDNEWTWVHGTSGRIPDGAHCSLSCYVRQNMTGTAWWDDVSIKLAREDPLDTVLVVPNYRDEVADAGPRKAVVRAAVDLRDYDLTLDGIQLAWRLLNGDRVAAHGCKKRVRVASFDLDVPVSRLEPGEYDLELTLVAKVSGETLSTKHHRLRRVKALPERTTYIDEHNRLILNGEPFFPLGMYWGGIKKDELDIYADSAFNCLMPYGGPSVEQMDWAQAAGLKVIYSVKDFYHDTTYCPADIKTDADELARVTEKVDAFHDHPALMAWYINDELPLDMLGRLTERQRLLESLDPNHPTWVVLYQVDSVRKYLPTFDAIGTDPYPLPSRPASMASEWTRKTVDAVAGARPVWQVPQVFNWACYRKTEEEKAACRPPAFEEMRSMIWQCIAQGAGGIVCYSWFDVRRDPARPFDETWPMLKTIAQEVSDLIPALLSIEKTPRIEVEEAAWLNWTVRRLGKTTYLIAVNNSTEAHKTSFTFRHAPKRVRLRGAGDIETSGKTLEVELAPLDVRIYETEGRP